MATNMMDGLRVQNAESLIRNFNTDDNHPRGYVFLGKATAWANDLEPPVPNNSVQEANETRQGVLAMKRIGVNDAYHMIRRNPWATGIVYDYYRHDITPEKPSYSGARTLYDSNYYVINSERDVFVCLNNNNNNRSFDEPKNRTGQPFFTSDGYQWLWIYHVSPTLITYHSTPNYLPVVTDEEDEPRTAGEILTVIVDYPGSDYTDNPQGSPTKVRAYYAHIRGDGVGAVAKVFVDGTFISKVEVVRQGRNYTFAQLDFRTNHVYKSLFDLDSGKNALNPEGRDDFKSTCIISPTSGWRSNNAFHLGGTTVGVFSRILFELEDFTVDVPFRQVGIIQDPQVTSDNPETASGVYSIKTLNINDGDFLLGEEISQQVNNKIARGIVVYWNQDEQLLRYIQNPSFNLSDGELIRFGGTGEITGTQSGKIVQSETNYSEDFKGVQFFNGYAQPEYNNQTGIVSYLANLQPIRRERNQAEKLSIMIHF